MRFEGTSRYVATEDLRVAVNAAIALHELPTVARDLLDPLPTDLAGHTLIRRRARLRELLNTIGGAT